jgi:hypothetical protein
MDIIDLVERGDYCTSGILLCSPVLAAGWGGLNIEKHKWRIHACKRNNDTPLQGFIAVNAMFCDFRPRRICSTGMAAQAW